MTFSSNSERAPYSRSKHGSFNVEEYHVDGPLKKKRCRRYCCCTMIACLVLLLVLFLVGLTLYLVLKPKYPSVEMSNIAVANVKVSPKRDGLRINALLSMNMTANLTAINPNRFRIIYSPTQADVSYKDLYVGNSTVPAIDQPGRSNHTISVLLVTDEIDVFKGTGLSLLKDSAKDAIPFTIVGVIKARIHFLGITSSLLKVKVTCDVVVHPRNQSLLEKTCKADAT
ncbi:hypothetical protein M758_2G086700 [Ceratodon purpureus]|nr:hypothetical protein M758_2G086700 [Ceratodon purpureus]